VSHVFLLQFFFHETSSPKPLKITLGSFQIFLKFAEILTSQSAPPVSTTLVGNLLAVSMTPAVKLPPVSMKMRQICHGVNDTSSKQ
jgi:hypothetical protein